MDRQTRLEMLDSAERAEIVCTFLRKELYTLTLLLEREDPNEQDIQQRVQAVLTEFDKIDDYARNLKQSFPPE